MKPHITDDEIGKALDFLRDNVVSVAQCRADRLYLDEYRKSLKALIMKEQPSSMSIAAKETEAYADPRYIAHIEALRDAINQDERWRFLMEAARIKIEAWRTQESNIRAAGKLA